MKKIAETLMGTPVTFRLPFVLPFVFITCRVLVTGQHTPALIQTVADIFLLVTVFSVCYVCGMSVAEKTSSHE